MKIIYKYECDCLDKCGHTLQIMERDDGRFVFAIFDKNLQTQSLSFSRDNLEHMMILMRMYVHQTENPKNGKPIPILCPKCNLPISLNYENHCECSR